VPGNFFERRKNLLFSLSSNNRLMFVIMTKCVSCEVRTEFLNYNPLIDLELSHDSECRATEKYGHEFRGTRKQE
jgi:hypothetical protein